MLQSLVVAFSMYSKIPMPRVDWNEKNMRYAMCFFPLIGVVIGVCQYIAACILEKTTLHSLTCAAVFTMIPIIISGGIHIDGFMDTMDARASYGDCEKKLEIMKDSHSGAFAMIGLVSLILCSVVIWNELNLKFMPVYCMIYPLSRAFSGFSVVTFPAAKGSGLLKTFQDGAQKKTVRIVMIVWMAAILGTTGLIQPVAAIALAVGVGIAFGIYAWICYKEFGGTTGDLAGFFLETSQLWMLAAMLIL